jgi:hypothetical protein
VDNSAVQFQIKPQNSVTFALKSRLRLVPPTAAMW